jgi:L,D-transpeptidase ErfK/SrfK
MRIRVDDSVIYSCPVRVGRNEVKYLKTVGRPVSLRTPVGEGRIIRIERNPWFVNPVTGHRYVNTRRDDGKYTRIPQIPWLEPMINGIRQGAMIHPTTNPVTLGQAYSNGCIGTREDDAWTIYYNAPIGTRVVFRYDLKTTTESGDTVELEDIYNLKTDAQLKGELHKAVDSHG